MGKKMTKRVFWIVLGLIGLVTVAGVGTGYRAGALRSGPAQFVTSSSTVVAKTPSLPGFKLTWSGTGDLSVPDDIAPGTYVIASDDRTIGCGWQRLSGKKVPKQGGLMAPGAASTFVTVDPGDGYLRLISCAFRRVS